MIKLIDQYDLISQEIGELPYKTEMIATSYDIDIYRLKFQKHDDLLIKLGRPKLRDHFKIEFESLKFLADQNLLKVKQPIFYNDDCLITPYFEHVPLGHHQEAEKVIAEHVAELHQIKSDRFGFDFDSLIGPLAQPNRYDANWIRFFKENRIQHFADLCFMQRLIDQDFLMRIRNFSERLEDHLLDNHRPTLIHGDLWFGNILTDGSELKSIIDPGLYFANPEVELAYVTMHNSLGDVFFKSYQETHQIDDGFFDLRKDIYNIYPNLVHILLCGREYMAPIDAVLKRHGY